MDSFGPGTKGRPPAMFPLWDKIIEPALIASRAQRVVEIGALRGDTTVRLLELLGPDAEVHVIDPVPTFDPTDHARRFPGRYIFHRDLSHNVLPTLPAVDAALIDGDHNWFTVHTELTMLRDAARAAGARLPLLVMHDVGWPYGRRDLYYASERIPEEQRQPFARRGMLPGHRELVAEGGLNPQLDHALVEGGALNGVRTALEDFAGDHDKPLRCVIIPIYFGLALVAEEELLDARPELAAVLDRLESTEALRELTELAEAIRIEEQINHQEAFLTIYGRGEHAAGLYLDLLKRALVDEHQLEDHRRVEQSEHCLDVIRREAVEGDLVDCGAQSAGSAIFMRGYLDAHGIAGGDLWLGGVAADRDAAREGFARFGLLDDRVKFLPGAPTATPESAEVDRIALLRVEGSNPAILSSALEALYDRIALGGFVVIDDHGTPGCERTVEAFRSERGITEPLERADGGDSWWRKTTHPLDPSRAPAAR